MQSVCVFCGSSPGGRPEYRAAAEALGAEIAQQGLTLVYGGGRVGLMGVVADAALAQGGKVIGVLPESLSTHELRHDGLTELHIVGSMHERKALMAERADAFVALPGGFGTLDEMCEILTWTQLGIQRKPCGILNVLGFFDPLLSLFDHAVAERFLSREHRALVLEETEPARLLECLRESPTPPLPKWLDREER